MGKVRIGIICAVFCLFFLSLGFSETILLKSGQKVEGRVIERTDKYVKLDFFGVDLVYYKEEIASIAQGVSGNENISSPQLESLYQAYTSSLNLPPDQKEEKAPETPALVLPQTAETSQTAFPAAPSASLSQMPPEYQKMIQSVMQDIQGYQAGLSGGSKPAVGMLDGNIPKIIPEYQEVIKSTIANLQTANSGFSDKKNN